jgi:hypothetical protein
MINFALIGAEPRQPRVYLEWVLRPERSRSLPTEEFYLDYPVTDQVLRQASALLRGQLRQAARGKMA